jgi:hypothetical protein
VIEARAVVWETGWAERARSWAVGLIERWRAAAARVLVNAAERMDPAALDEKFRHKISAVTVETVKAMMDHQGLARCDECPQRLGLYRDGHTLRCEIHRLKNDGGDRG